MVRQSLFVYILWSKRYSWLYPCLFQRMQLLWSTGQREKALNVFYRSFSDRKKPSLSVFRPDSTLDTPCQNACGKMLLQA